jgi:hypothetical protein
MVRRALRQSASYPTDVTLDSTIGKYDQPWYAYFAARRLYAPEAHVKWEVQIPHLFGVSP